MPKALIKGETHLSKKDKQALMDFDLSNFDAVFREGYDKDYFQRDIDSLYALFAIGHVVYGATYGRFYMSTDGFRAKAENQDVPFHGKIDAAIHETYEMVSNWKRALLFALSPFFAAIILGLISTPFRLVVEKLAPQWMPALVYSAAIGMIFVFGFAWALAYFLLIEGRAMYDRDEGMAESILQISDEEGYQTVLVSCGGNHRKGIANYLRDEGWDVEEQTTDSPIGKIYLWKEWLVNSLSPKEHFNGIVASLKSLF
ncbi:hypothetical protein ACH9L7_19805 (plasmid) [Haloferax sp. S1W]|uniref:hypothetical protein n=1 Tax=Haloferax sp. S1W TaxID=3377110 RepID=UPI0037C70534